MCCQHVSKSWSSSDLPTGAGLPRVPRPWVRRGWWEGVTYGRFPGLARLWTIFACSCPVQGWPSPALATRAATFSLPHCESLMTKPQRSGSLHGNDPGVFCLWHTPASSSVSK